MPRRRSKGAVRVAQGLWPIGGTDLVHGLDIDLPLRSSGPTVATVHDLAVFDVPWAFSRYRATGERQVVARSVARADALIAVSNFSAERIEHHFGRSATVTPLAPPGDVVPHCPEAVAVVRQQYDLPPRFVLQLASIEPRKDVDLLADVCRAHGMPLILAGANHQRRSWAGARHLGYVPEEHLAPLLDAADIIAYLSHYEGFGLPPLEAMVRGRPVVANAVGALPDVAADGARLVAPGDRDRLADALNELWSDHEARRELGRRGRRAVGDLSWSATAAATLEVYRGLGVPV